MCFQKQLRCGPEPICMNGEDRENCKFVCVGQEFFCLFIYLFIFFGVVCFVLLFVCLF